MYSDGSWSNYLIRNNIIENDNQLRRREGIMQLLQQLRPPLIYEIRQESNLKKDNIECQIIPFGSYGLGAHLATGDIDVCVISPSPVRRRDFFRLFADILKKQHTVQDILVLDNARVPIIKCTIDRIPVDISFVRLKKDTIARDINILDNALLVGLDEPCMGSFSGPRTLQFMLKHIDPDHLGVFRTVVQCIKWWSMQRSLYDKFIGYLNSNALTLLLLKTYMNERAAKHPIGVSSLLAAFFAQWSLWPWPTPVMLTDFIADHDGTPVDYKSLTDFTSAPMPILTPCYRVENAAPHVTKSTLRVLRREFSRGDIMRSEFDSDEAMIRKLFKPFDLVRSFTHILKVVFSSDTLATHESWLRKIPDILPRLIEFLEEVPEIRQIQPYTKSYVKAVSYRNRGEKTMLQLGDRIEKTEMVRKGPTMDPGLLHRTIYLIGLDVIPAEDNGNTIDISRQVKMFRSVVDSKRNTKERDLVVHITAAKRRDIDSLIKEHM
ncbi:hypothetical protein BJV82DRAFT_523354 [Fennellomyces sp. T-0311]|nr:hypothetical protein BJV82DRAFT_523354 [Fennellomyces sp. T-0311]